MARSPLPSGPEDLSSPEGGTLLADYPGLPPAGRAFLEDLIRMQLLGRSAAGLFLQQFAEQLGEFGDEEVLGNALIQAGLLTSYQFDRIMAGTTHGLVLGNHRVLDRLGAGSMGVVFLAEHALLKRRVAIKVLPVDETVPAALLERFYAEMRVLADLRHPNIVMAFDAGKIPGPNPGMPALHYLVLELVPGGDLEQYVVEHGPVPVAQACEWICQAAAGLQAAHDHHLIHRDVKPSNLLLSAEGQVKLVDFGLARQFCSQLTDPRALLGSIDFMAPEQSFDPSTVGPQADIYGLGATLFWLLTGQPPFPPEKSVARALRALQTGRPRRLRSLRPDAPAELDALIARMLDRDPAERPALPVAVMNALSRFAAPAAGAWVTVPGMPAAAGPAEAASTAWQVLIADEQPALRQTTRASLEPLGCVCGEVDRGDAVLTAIRETPYDLILLSRGLPDLNGLEVCRRLREEPPRPHLKIVLLSPPEARNELTEALAVGADDFVTKPFDPQQLAAKVQSILRLKDAQEYADRLARNLLSANQQLEHSLKARDSDVRRAQDALLFAMAKLAESRDGETAGHLYRLQRYCRVLGEQLAQMPGWSGIVSESFLDQLERCVPLHDIGKLGLPDAVLLKPGPLTDEERAVMQSHTLIGAGILDSLAREYGDSLAFLAVASMIVRYHHERYDGLGYPDGLAGDAIPPAARIVALADVYDALRRKRAHKPALTHAEAVKVILEESDGQFDPSVVAAFHARQDDFQRIFHQVRN
ncbi:MAG: protein kinase [Gemmataceae bacterium]|nr:protein kinase [Gemmataceae bacterium]MDW8263896.1 protein kinase [Gemmataceae bacterium]